MSTRSGPGDGRPDPGLNAIMSERRQLINLAYRLLGSLAEAEDAVQETYARWYAMSAAAAGRHRIPRRLADDGRQPHLPGPARLGPGPARALRRRMDPRAAARPGRVDQRAAGGATADPADRVTLDESVSMAFLVVLESMTPAERVAFILHDVFGYSFAEVAEITGRTPAACRQLASSARRRVRAVAASRDPDGPAGRHRQGLQAGMGSQGHRRPHRPARPRRHGDRRRRRPGQRRAAPDRRRRADRALPRRYRRPGTRQLTILERTVNGQPGLVAQQDGVTVTVFAFDFAGDRITHIWAVRNPDKLRPWTAR